MGREAGAAAGAGPARSSAAGARLAVAWRYASTGEISRVSPPWMSCANRRAPPANAAYDAGDGGGRTSSRVPLGATRSTGSSGSRRASGGRSGSAPSDIVALVVVALCSRIRRAISISASSTSVRSPTCSEQRVRRSLRNRRRSPSASSAGWIIPISVSTASSIRNPSRRAPSAASS